MKKWQLFLCLSFVAIFAFFLVSYFFIVRPDRNGMGAVVPAPVKQVKEMTFGIAGTAAGAALARTEAAPIRKAVMPMLGSSPSNLKDDKNVVRDLKGVTRVRKIGLSPELLNGELDKFSKGDKLEFEFFDDARFAGNITRTGTNVNGTAALSGKLENEIYSSFATASTGGIFAAEFSIPRTGMDYAIYPRDGKYYVFEFRRLDRGAIENGDSKIPPPLPPGFVMNEVVSGKLLTAASNAANPPRPQSVGDPASPTQIDVLIAYTSSANSYATTNHGSMANAISLMMTKSQACLDNSDINIAWNLVYSYQTNYTELNTSKDLDNFTFSASYDPWNDEGATKYMEEVHSYRITYGADICALLENMEFTGGLGWQLDDTAGQKELAFHIARIQQVTWTSTDIHEAGHNMGAHHSRSQTNSPGPGLYSYSAGWQWPSSPKPSGYTVGYCTIMTYENFDNNSGNGVEYMHIDSFSDPNLSPAAGGGNPSGTTTDNNARGLREIKDVIASYYSLPGFTLSKSSLTVLENGGTGTFTVVLTTQPASNVVFSVTSSAVGEATVAPVTLTFTAANWNIAQTVTITGVNDNNLGNNASTVTVSVIDASSDNNWDPLADKTVAVTCTNDDVAGFAVSAISGNTTEAGGTATFTVRLTSQPTANVSISLSSSDTSEGTVSPATLTFSSANWNINQAVTVTGVDDSIIDGNVAYSIVTAAALSADPNYNGLNPSDVPVTNIDNDYTLTVENNGNGTTVPSGASLQTKTAAVTISATPSTGYHFVNWTVTSGSVTFENANSAGTTATASANATIRANFAINVYAIIYSAGSNGTLTGSTSQSVRHGENSTAVTAVPNAGYYFSGWSDGVMDNPRTDMGVTAAKSVTANFALNDVQITTDLTSLIVNEGVTNSFQVKLTMQPPASKTVTVSRFSGDSDITVSSGASLSFTTSNWNTYRTVTLAAAQDSDTTNGSAIIRCSSTGMTDKDVTAYESDNDYTLTVSNDGNGTTVPSGASVQTKGAAASIAATSGTGYNFLNWTVTSGSATLADANSASTTAMASADATVRANFAIKTYALTYNAGANGTVTGTSPQTINHGANGTAVTAVPNPNYHFVKWSDNMMAASRTDTNITANLTVTATFAINTYTVTFDLAGKGAVTDGGALSQTVNYGSGAIAPTVTANIGWTFTGWDKTFDNITETTNVIAQYSIITYAVTFDLAGKGTSTGGGELSQVINHGSAATAPTVSPKPGWTFNGWDNPFADVTSNRTVTALWIIGPPVIKNPGTQNAMVGVQFTLPLTVESESSLVKSVAVSGLPTGLKFDSKAMAITGVPSAVGNKVVTVTAKNDFKTPAVLTFNITVDPLPAWAQGTFNGWGVDGNDHGTATMTVTGLGKVTGKLSASGKNFPFSAASYSHSDEDEALWISTKIIVDKVDVPLIFKVANPEGVNPISLSLAKGWPAGKVEGEPAIKMYRNVWKDTGAAAILEPYIGYYTAVLPGGAEYGSGYLTITVDKAGVVKTTGKLADGTALSLSGILIIDGNEPACMFTVIYTSPAACQGGCLFGLAELVKPDEAGSHVFLRPLDGSNFLWENLNPVATADYEAGFQRELGLSGGWYDKTGNLDDYYHDKVLTVGVGSSVPASWNLTGLDLTPVLNSSGVMTGLSAPNVNLPVKVNGEWDYSAENTAGLKTGLTRATGIFKGSFKVWFDYNTTHTSKSVSYEGVLIPEREFKDDGIEGRGFFLWPDKGQYINPLGRTVTYPFNWSYDFIVQSGE